MVVTIGVTIRKKNQPTGFARLWADFELQFDTFPPIRGNPEETLNVDVGLIYCCGSFYIEGWTGLRGWKNHLINPNSLNFRTVILSNRDWLTRSRSSMAYFTKKRPSTQPPLTVLCPYSTKVA